MKSKKTIVILVLMLLTALFFIGCAAKNEMFVSKPAGFWASLWHGLIIIVTFVISLFTDSVGVYEVNNSGGWYNFGFVFGTIIALGHGGLWSPVKKKKHPKGDKEKEWEDYRMQITEHEIKKYLPLL